MHKKVICFMSKFETYTNDIKISAFAEAKAEIIQEFLERMDGVRGRKGEPFCKKVSLPSLIPFTLIELLVITAQYCRHFISNACTVLSQNTPLFLK